MCVWGLDSGGALYLGVRLPRELSSPSFPPCQPKPACLPPSPGTDGSVPGSAFLSTEPLVSSCNESQPQLSSCQTGFFKNISVFTQHELISLQCPWGLIGGRGCALGTPPHPVLKCQYHLWELVARLPPLPSARPRVLAGTGSRSQMEQVAFCRRDLAAHKK